MVKVKAALGAKREAKERQKTGKQGRSKSTWRYGGAGPRHKEVIGPVHICTYLYYMHNNCTERSGVVHPVGGRRRVKAGSVSLCWPGVSLELACISL